MGQEVEEEEVFGLGCTGACLESGRMREKTHLTINQWRD